MAIDDLLKTLAAAPQQRFADWRNANVPLVTGVYLIWDRDQHLLYVGMAGSKNGNLRKRLGSHARGGRGGDQFCLYVFDRFVLPLLTAEEIRKAADDRISLDAKTGDYIRTNYSYSFVTTENTDDARALEARAQHGVPSIGKPLLNPL